MAEHQSFILKQIKSITPEKILEISKDDDEMWVMVCRKACINPDSIDAQKVRTQI